VNVTWAVRDGRLRLNWEESGGPPVAPPTRKGFGTRPLKALLAHDLGGDMRSRTKCPACDVVRRLRSDRVATAVPKRGAARWSGWHIHLQAANSVSVVTHSTCSPKRFR
jgi:hypothetical protein